MTLRNKQSAFARNFARLILRIYDQGYEVTISQVLRTRAEAARNAAAGSGIKNSIHCLKLAADLNLFKNGRWLKDTESHRVFGEWWKKQHPLARWGGDFRRRDGNHYSFTHGGVS